MVVVVVVDGIRDSHSAFLSKRHGMSFHCPLNPSEKRLFCIFDCKKSQGNVSAREEVYSWARARTLNL